MKTVSLKDVDTRAVGAVVMEPGGAVVVRYTDGKEPVTIEGVTTSQVMVQILKNENDNDS